MERGSHVRELQLQSIPPASHIGAVDCALCSVLKFPQLTEIVARFLRFRLLVVGSKTFVCLCIRVHVHTDPVRS